MDIKVTIKSAEKEKQPEKPVEKEKEEKSKVNMKLAIRKTLDGKIVIYDHKDLDIVIDPKTSKIIAFPKEMMGDHIYDSQDRLFSFLSRKGIIERDTIQNGNVYFSMEAKIPSSPNFNVLQNVVFTIGRFLDDEKPYFEYEEKMENEMEQRLTEPDPEDSTEFDARRHAERKGSLQRARYGMSSIYRM